MSFGAQRYLINREINREIQCSLILESFHWGGYLPQLTRIETI
jgi:hypothetical protein